jgi:hypothetical protein
VTTLPLPSRVSRVPRTHALARPGPTAAVWALVIVCLISGLIGRLAYLYQPFDHDARMFIYLGKLVCDGGRYCHDVIDNKFPSVGLLTSICWRMFGTNWAAYVLLQTGLSLASALMLARTAARHFGRHAGLPTALFAVVYLNLNVAVFGGFQLETIQIFFAVLAASSALEALGCGDHRDAFLCGLAAGCAMMIKPTGGAVLGAFALASIVAWRRDRIRIVTQGLAVLGGLLLPATVVFIYLVATDITADMPALVRQIARYAADTPWAPADPLKPVVVAVIAAFPIVVRAWVFRRERLNIPVDRAMAIFASAWFALELAGAVAQRRMYAYHFLPVAAPAALLYGIWPRRSRVMPMAAALIPAALLSVIGGRDVYREHRAEPARLAVSDYIAARTRPGDAVWMDSMARLLLETGLQPGSRIPLTFLFLNDDAAPLEYSAVLIDDFGHRRPKYIVLPKNIDQKLAAETAGAPELARRPLRAMNYRLAWHRIERYVMTNYRSEAVLDRQVVWRRRD